VSYKVKVTRKTKKDKKGVRDSGLCLRKGQPSTISTRVLGVSFVSTGGKSAVVGRVASFWKVTGRVARRVTIETGLNFLMTVLSVISVSNTSNI